MRLYIKKISYLLSLISIAFVFGACADEFLDRKPLDSITPGQFLNTEADLASYPINYYLSIFPNHGQGWSTGIGRFDDHTDNQITSNPNLRLYVEGNWRVDENGSLGLGNIRAFNYFLEQVLPKYKEEKISGNVNNIKHYIGEVYMLRAAEYFNKLKTYGDFPIIRNTLPDQADVLTEAAKRAPRNEVARFIISDLDSAILLLQDNMAGKTRITKDAAKLLKARVAMNEASFLTYHKGTPRVPGEQGWPGANMEYNSGFSINLDSEIDYFLSQAMETSKDIAERIPLTLNSYALNPSDNPTGWNPYFEMFGARNMSSYPEILLWREYSLEHRIAHTVSINIRNGANTGLTKGLVDGYLMKNGLPIYDPASGYQGDKSIMDAKANRDGRLGLFLAGEEDVRGILDVKDKDGNIVPDLYGYPLILGITETRDVTGYKSRKFMNYSPDESNATDQIGTAGSPIFRAAEAYLIYLEASYMKSKTIDATAAKYWRAIRERAGVDTDFNKTIQATNMAEEAKGDWGAYSGGTLVDATLYNIRRERRNEFVSEGMRFDDLIRWRAMDQVKNYIVEGFNLWDEAYLAEAYKPVIKDGNVVQNGLIFDGSSKANVSSLAESGKYLRPYQKIKANNEVYNGYNWSKANYLSPVPYRQMQLTSPDGNAENSNFYQNPYWPTAPNGEAVE